MHTKTTRALIGAAVTLTLAGGLAACGDDDTGTNGMDRSNMPMNTTVRSTTPATGKQIDEAFVRQMIPHHEMAVVMAKSAQKQAEHQEIKDLADAIIAAQEKEIRELRQIAKDSGFDVGSAGPMMAGDARMMGMDMDDMGMSMRAEDLDGASDFDRAFIAMMVPHHRGAIAMAEVELAKGSDPELKTLAKGIIAAQQTEIAKMRGWYEEWFGKGLDENAPAAGMGEMDHGDHMN